MPSQRLDTSLSPQRRGRVPSTEVMLPWAGSLGEGLLIFVGAMQKGIEVNWRLLNADTAGAETS